MIQLRSEHEFAKLKALLVALILQGKSKEAFWLSQRFTMPLGGSLTPVYQEMKTYYNKHKPLPNKEDLKKCRAVEQEIKAMFGVA